MKQLFVILGLILGLLLMLVVLGLYLRPRLASVAERAAALAVAEVDHCTALNTMHKAIEDYCEEPTEAKFDNLYLWVVRVEKASWSLEDAKEGYHEVCN